jgi:hypothetical protein
MAEELVRLILKASRAEKRLPVFGKSDAEAKS